MSHVERHAAVDQTLLQPLRVGIDGEALRKPLSGVGTYVFNLCRELELLLPNARFFVYTRLAGSRLALPSARWLVRREDQPCLRALPSFLWLRTRGARLCAADNLDVFWGGRTLHPRLPRSVLSISTIHDLNHLIVPDTMQNATRWSHRLWFRRDARRANFVVANSHGTAARAAAMLGVQADAVVQPGLHPRFRPHDIAERATDRAQLAALGLVEPYLLTVATLEPRKNVSRLLQAFLQLKAEGLLAAHRLVVVGANGWSNHGLEQDLKRSRAQGVMLLGYIPDALLPGLYCMAEAVLMPSLYEGFGMPALEARACGQKVVVSDIPELREAAGQGAIVVEPTVAGIRAGILQALREPAVRSDTPALQSDFSWQAGARTMARLITTPVHARSD